MISAVRPPAVAGSFYPADPAELRAMVQRCVEAVPREQRVVRGAIVPHAGLVYSGRCAGAVLARLAFPPVVVILAPNHTGMAASPRAGLLARGAMATPLGAIEVDEAFGRALLKVCDLVEDDPLAHRREHAVELELPFLSVLAPASRVVPLVLSFDDWPRCERLAGALSRCVESWPDPVLLLASSDMTHYEPAAAAARKDRLALAAIERLDGRALLEVCRRERVTMCGRAPAAVVVEAARRLGATRGELLDYRHSGEVTGDDSQVVSYAGVVIA